jgi:transposase
MKGYTLSREKIAELEKFHRTLRDKRQADCVKAVIALSRGWSSAQVAEILLFDEKTSRHYFERYRQGGLQALPDTSEAWQDRSQRHCRQSFISRRQSFTFRYYLI